MLSFSLEKEEKAMTPNGVFLGIKWILKIPNDTFLAKKKRDKLLKLQGHIVNHGKHQQT